MVSHIRASIYEIKYHHINKDVPPPNKKTDVLHRTLNEKYDIVSCLMCCEPTLFYIQKKNIAASPRVCVCVRFRQTKRPILHLRLDKNEIICCSAATPSYTWAISSFISYYICNHILFARVLLVDTTNN